MKRLLWKVWDSVSLYLPIILMALMAMATYWLARSTPALLFAPVAAPVSQDPDYYMRRFAVKSFDPAGRLKSEVRGDEALHYPATDTVKITQPRMRAYNEGGQRTIASANQALSNNDGSEVQLIGNAVVMREGTAKPGAKPSSQAPPSLEFRGEFLHAFSNADRLKSHKPVVLTRGQDRFSADTMEYDSVTQVMLLNGRVRGTLMPAAR
jgi:lipopolysaccharide export system protein LptC